MDAELEHYLLTHSDKEPSLLKALSRDTQANLINGRMVSGNLQGRFLVMLSRMIQPRQILELGTFTGYSALCFAEGSPEDAEIHTIEHNDELKERIQDWFDKSGFGHKITLHIGDALDVIQTFNTPFDLAFIDLDKRLYKECYEAILPLVKPGGFILIDNTLWSGKVLEEIHSNDTQSLAIFDFNNYLAADTRVEKVMIPLRDGMTLVHKKR
jgi:caffeoyl-CoA O-methyltransferase